jgi:hypothetical protein
MGRTDISPPEFSDLGSCRRSSSHSTVRRMSCLDGNGEPARASATPSSELRGRGDRSRPSPGCGRTSASESEESLPKSTKDSETRIGAERKRLVEPGATSEEAESGANLSPRPKIRHRFRAGAPKLAATHAAQSANSGGQEQSHPANPAGPCPPGGALSGLIGRWSRQSNPGVA